MHAILLILAAITAFLLGHATASYQQVKLKAGMARYDEKSRLDASLKEVKKNLIKCAICTLVVNGLNVIYNFIL